MEYISIETTKEKEIVDVTPFIEKQISKKGFVHGVCFLFVTHTSCALTTADLDPGTDLDMLDAFENMIPKLKYRHPHDPSHVPDHILSALIGTSLTLPLQNGSLVLGTWQRVVLVEFNGPRKRDIILKCLR